MRFMMLMIPGVYQDNNGLKMGVDFTPAAEEVEKMMKYNEDLAQAGALISLDGLHPPVEAVRVSFTGGKQDVKYGPFIETRNVVGGYWIIEVASRDEAVEWAKRVPARDEDMIEIRQVFEVNEFSDEAQRAADNPAVLAQVEMHKRPA